ncbi:hypothetical protein [Solidesulfovibrio magneticus]|uniref:Uncharacterized protein n=1 Tax=Solidesulfovibrio magneticus (strain ATCC 700980 / DSM 13731 / RS-1) TaxID=573370 RepID=C4XRX0_SOLM1|nr:hypothetical protein [Solidesulfovibrio magneticus]BAH78036.1 hypothetical protein DMR_45450 [Solidesulfovibrio magneticus RS-1]
MFVRCSLLVLQQFLRSLSLFACCSFIELSLFLERFFAVPCWAFSGLPDAVSGHGGRSALCHQAGHPGGSGKYGKHPGTMKPQPPVPNNDNQMILRGKTTNTGCSLRVFARS